MAVTRAYEHAKELLNEGKLVFDERDAWSEHRPSAGEENDSFVGPASGAMTRSRRLSGSRPRRPG